MERLLRFLPQGGGRGTTVEGRLSKADLIEFHRLVDKIRQTALTPSDIPWTGLLAEGPITDPHHTILYQYRQGNHQKATDADASFEAVIELLKPYVQKFYNAVDGTKCPFKPGDWVIYSPRWQGYHLEVGEQLTVGGRYEVERIEKDEYVVIEGCKHPEGGIYWTEFSPEMTKCNNG